MSRRLVNEIKDHFESKSNEQLLEIWKQNDRDAYSDTAFEAIGQILSERNVTVPAQSAFVPKPPAEQHNKDGKIGRAIKRKEDPDKPIFCSLVQYSLILFLLPLVGWLIGLLLAIISIRKISKSNGLLYGKTLAWISLILNALPLFFLLVGILMPFIDKYIIDKYIGH